MDEDKSKFSLEVQKRTFESCFKTKITFKHILEYARVIPCQIYNKLKKIDENQGTSRNVTFQYKIPHFYPLWGAYLISEQLKKSEFAPQT